MLTSIASRSSRVTRSWRGEAMPLCCQ